MKYKVHYKMLSFSKERGWTEFSELLDRRDLNELLKFVETSNGRYVILYIVPHSEVEK